MQPDQTPIFLGCTLRRAITKKSWELCKYVGISPPCVHSLHITQFSQVFPFHILKDSFTSQGAIILTHELCTIAIVNISLQQNSSGEKIHYVHFISFWSDFLTTEKIV